MFVFTLGKFKRKKLTSDHSELPFQVWSLTDKRGMFPVTELVREPQFRSLSLGGGQTFSQITYEGVKVPVI